MHQGIIKKTVVIAADEVLWEEHDDVWKVNLEKLMEVGLRKNIKATLKSIDFILQTRESH